MEVSAYPRTQEGLPRLSMRWYGIGHAKLSGQFSKASICSLLISTQD